MRNDPLVIERYNLELVSLRTRPQLGETSPITRDQEVPTRTLTYLTSQGHGRQNTTKVDADRREVVFFFALL